MKTGADTGPCPACGEPRGGRYLHNGEWLCWPCTGLKPLEPPPLTLQPWQQFRAQIIDRLLSLEKAHRRLFPNDDFPRYWYIDSDRFIGICPVCLAEWPEHLSVRFHGQAARAEIACSLGCPDSELAEAFGIGVRS